MAEICHCSRKFSQCEYLHDDTLVEFGSLEIRSRARKLAQEIGNLGLSSDSDYLQLITVGLEEKTVNSGVSEISSVKDFWQSKPMSGYCF